MPIISGPSPKDLAANVDSVFGRTGAVVAVASDYAGLAVSGFEIAYDQITGTVNIASTSEGAPTAVIAGTSHVYEAVPYLFHFHTPVAVDSSAAGGTLTVLLMEDAASIGRIAVLDSVTVATQIQSALTGELRFTPTAAAHTFGISAFVSSATGTPSVGAGAGGSGVVVPAFLRVTKV